MATQDQLMTVLKQLATTPDINQEALADAMLGLTSDSGFTRDENILEHFCVFCVPVVMVKKLIYMGHHIKADSWIPPGGHIDRGESPIKAVKREFEEELQHKITFEIVQLYDITIDNIESDTNLCKKHFNLWYLVQMASPEDFMYDVGEFTDAGWMTFTEAAGKTHPTAKKVIERLALTK